MAVKQKAEKMSRKDIVTCERAVQLIRESVYRIRRVLEPGMDEQLVAEGTVAQVKDANKAADNIIHESQALLDMVREFPVLEDMDGV